MSVCCIEAYRISVAKKNDGRRAYFSAAPFFRRPLPHVQGQSGREEKLEKRKKYKAAVFVGRPFDRWSRENSVNKI